MRISIQAELFDALMQLSERYPHWRFGQLVANVSGWADSEIWDVEDEQLLRAVKEHLQQQAVREPIATDRQ